MNNTNKPKEGVTTQKIADTIPSVDNAVPPSQNRIERRGRTPLHKQKRIGLKTEPGYYYRLVTDEGDRIPAFKKAGYELIEAESREGAKDASYDSQIGKYARQSVGGGKYGYYMRIPKEQWQEDQKDKQKAIDVIEKQIFNANIAGHEVSNTYGEIKVDIKSKG